MGLCRFEASLVFGLHSKFQGYIERLGLKQNNNNNNNELREEPEHLNSIVFPYLT